MNIINKLRFFKKTSIGDTFKHFLQHTMDSSVRRPAHQKERRYQHVEISQEFKRQEEIRKSHRLEHIKQRKILIQQKISTQSKLLSEGEKKQLSDIGEEIMSLELILKNQEKSLEELSHKIEGSEADYILFEGPMKITILNQIQYLRHMNLHPSGLNLHPETIKVIENVHYLVNNNLPVNRFKIYELMPEYFIKEIGELDESMQKIIQEKSLDPESDPNSSIRFFVRHKSRSKDPDQQMIDILDERSQISINFEEKARKMLQEHLKYLDEVEEGRTPFRSAQHMATCFLSSHLQLILSPEEQALKNTIQQVILMREKFFQYLDDVDLRLQRYRNKRPQIPPWVVGHPILMKRFEEVALIIMNPIDIQDTQLLPESQQGDEGLSYFTQKLHQVVRQKFDSRFIQLWNSGKKDELVANKKKFEIEFYNESTKILEQYKEMIAEQKQQDFKKLPRIEREVIEEVYSKITFDEITKAIYLNVQEPHKYTIQFFTKFFGFENQNQAKKLFNSISYLRIPVQAETTIDKIKKQLIKFTD